jgi:hypothetical protein
MDLRQNLARSSLGAVNSQHTAEMRMVFYPSCNTIVCCDLLDVLTANELGRCELVTVMRVVSMPCVRRAKLGA